ncbi:signal transduction histidine kinase [Flavobacterium limnosediminis JC2902]|uniref:histidine kinase n=1 Tax=Flavobacterium limnosediminis JC2902 TaxID=1341181 RepID=V6SK74_9FLAO|nr:tetratricopeptide repeat-containing sensor histidine kinase [Flavobacterium limnosediminis]ESU26647.1 signal transduction histidine kinase [Flavobacterium limnosediminis JC2902]
MKDSFAYYKENNQFQKAFDYSDKKAAYFFTKKQYSNYIRQITNKTTLLTNDIKDPKRSLKLIYESLSKLKNTSDFEKVKLYPELARTYFRLQRFDKAIDIAQKGMKTATVSKNDTVIFQLNYNILSAYLSVMDTQNSYKYLEPTLKGAKKIKDNKKIAEVYNNHFVFYNYIKERDIAKKYLDSSVIYAEKSKDKYIINSAKSNLGVHYLAEEIDYKKAKDIYLQLIEENKNDSLNEILSTCYLNISLVYEKSGDLKSANNYLNKYADYTYYAVQNKFDSEIEGMRTKYELEKAEIKFKEQEQLLKQKQLKSEKMFYLLLALLALAGVLFYFFYQNLRLKQKNKLKDLNHSVQQNLVNATIDGQEEERKRLSGVLHDNISALLSSASLHLMAFEANHPEIDGELKKTKAIIKEAHDKVRDLSHDLIPPVLEKLGLIAAFEDLCEKNSNSLIHFQFNNFIQEEIRFQNEFEMKLYFIVAELFNNIIKHSNASEAFLTLDKDDDQLSITIEDNGKGFNNKEGKQKQKEGLGLSQIKTRVKSLNGNISISSKEKSGVLIYIKVKVPELKSDTVSDFHNV